MKVSGLNGSITTPCVGCAQGVEEDRSSAAAMEQFATNSQIFYTEYTGVAIPSVPRNGTFRLCKHRSLFQSPVLCGRFDWPFIGGNQYQLLMLSAPLICPKFVDWLLGPKSPFDVSHVQTLHITDLLVFPSVELMINRLLHAIGGSLSRLKLDNPGRSWGE